MTKQPGGASVANVFGYINFSSAVRRIGIPVIHNLINVFLVVSTNSHSKFAMDRETDKPDFGDVYLQSDFVSLLQQIHLGSMIVIEQANVIGVFEVLEEKCHSPFKSSTSSTQDSVKNITCNKEK